MLEWWELLQFIFQIRDFYESGYDQVGRKTTVVGWSKEVSHPCGSPRSWFAKEGSNIVGEKFSSLRIHVGGSIFLQRCYCPSSAYWICSTIWSLLMLQKKLNESWFVAAQTRWPPLRKSEKAAIFAWKLICEIKLQIKSPVFIIPLVSYVENVHVYTFFHHFYQMSSHSEWLTDYILMETCVSPSNFLGYYHKVLHIFSPQKNIHPGRWKARTWEYTTGIPENHLNQTIMTSGSSCYLVGCKLPRLFFSKIERWFELRLPRVFFFPRCANWVLKSLRWKSRIHLRIDWK